MLCERFPPATVPILPLWRPYPDARDRAAWESLPVSVRRPWISSARALADRPWPALPAALYLEYARNGNRSRYEAPYFERRTRLATMLLAECMEDRGELLDRVADGVWLVCEETSWCIPAHIGAQRAGSGLPDATEPTLDLFAAETAAALAWTSSLLGSRLQTVSPLIGPRIRSEVARRVIDPFLAREDYFWMGLAGHGDRPNNWNPWICSNVLAAGLLLEDDEARRRAVVAKAMRVLDRFLDPYPRDGGCDEGPGYWSRAGGSLLDCLETLGSATGGTVDLWQEPVIREIGRYVARAQIAGDYYVNFADASAVVVPPAGVAYRYGERIRDPDLIRFGASLASRMEDGARIDMPSPERALRELFLHAELARADAASPLPRDCFLPETGLAIARDRGGSERGYFVAAKGGHNGESHNHNDVGSFVVYVDGKPLLVDAGVGEYTRATFSPDRYSIWTMQSAYHNLLPTVDGVMQASGREHAATGLRHAADDRQASFELELAAAYPPESGIRSWRRRIALRRGSAVEINDSWELSRDAGEITLALLTPCTATAGASGEVGLAPATLPGGRSSAGGRLLLEPAAGIRATTAVERIAIDDARLAAVWGSGLTRIVVSLRAPPRTGELRLTVTAG